MQNMGQENDEQARASTGTLSIRGSAAIVLEKQPGRSIYNCPGAESSLMKGQR
jgi:hypothetical protein